MLPIIVPSASSFDALADKTTADLLVNTPLTNALAAKANTSHTHTLDNLGLVNMDLFQNSMSSKMWLAGSSSSTGLGTSVIRQGAPGAISYSMGNGTSTGATLDAVIGAYSRATDRIASTTAGQVAGLLVYDQAMSFRKSEYSCQAPRRITVIFGIDDVLTQSKHAYGFSAYDYLTRATFGFNLTTVQPISNNTAGAGRTSFLGFAANSDHTNLRFMARCSTGTEHIVDLGSGFPVNTGQKSIFKIDFEFSPGSATVDPICYWRITNLFTNAVASGTVTSAQTNNDALVDGVILGFFAVKSNGHPTTGSGESRPFLAAYVTDAFLEKVTPGPAPSTPVTRTITGSATATKNDDGGLIIYNSVLSGEIIIPPLSQVNWSTLSTLSVLQLAAGVPAFAAGPGVTLLVPNYIGASTQYYTSSVIMVSPNVWVLR